MERVDIPDDYNCFKIRYFVHPASPYARTQREQATEFIISYFREEDHPFIYDNLGNKKTKLVRLYSVYIPNKTHL